MPAMFFADKQAAITSIAYLYGEAARTSQLGQECLAALEENSGFDRIRFVNLEGESFASDGKIASMYVVLTEERRQMREASCAMTASMRPFSISAISSLKAGRSMVRPLTPLST